MWSNVRVVALLGALAVAALGLGGCMLSLSVNAECQRVALDGLPPSSCELPW